MGITSSFDPVQQWVFQVQEPINEKSFVEIALLHVVCCQRTKICQCAEGHNLLHSLCLSMHKQFQNQEHLVLCLATTFHDCIQF